MAAEIQKTLQITSELIPSQGGVFEVTVDGKAIFSKKATGRFPEPAEIIQAIQRMDEGKKKK